MQKYTTIKDILALPEQGPFISIIALRVLTARSLAVSLKSLNIIFHKHITTRNSSEVIAVTLFYKICFILTVPFNLPSKQEKTYTIHLRKILKDAAKMTVHVKDLVSHIRICPEQGNF